MTQEELFKTLTAHAKEYGFIFQSSEIYDGLGAVYDYGQMGVELKNNIKKYWWEAMVHLNENIVGIDSAIFMHPKIWEASGHLSAFNDPLIDNRDSKKRYRADVLIEDYLAKLEERINKEVEKGRRRFGEAFDEEQFRTTNPNVLRNKTKWDEVNTRMVEALNSDNLAELKQIIIDCELYALFRAPEIGLMCVSSISCSVLNWAPFPKRRAPFTCVRRLHRASL